MKLRTASVCQCSGARSSPSRSTVNSGDGDWHPMKYTVMCDDNFHYMDEAERVVVG